MKRISPDYRPPAPTPMDALLAGTPLGTALAAADAARHEARQATTRDMQRAADAVTLPARQQAVPFVAGRVTSRDAAQAMERTGTAASHQVMVLAYLEGQGEQGATDIELDEHFRQAGVRFLTMRPRRIALVASGAVVDSGRTRMTPSGRKSVVWVARQWAERQAAA